MKKWLKFLGLSFFRHKIAKEGARRDYANAFLGFVLALVFIWVGLFTGDMLPFGVHYSNSHDFKAMVHSVFANSNADNRICAEIEDGVLKVKNQDGTYSEGLLINTFENEKDRQNYLAGAYNVVVDLRPANTIAEIEAYCVSNDGKSTVISYEDYLTLSEVARLNFDFKLRYTGNALELTDELAASYKEYVEVLNDESKAVVQQLENDLADDKITGLEYSRGIYELYFVNYYPEITEYESTSKVPLLRNYYYHKYISQGEDKYLFVFDDYMAGSFETKNGIDVSFYGFYSDLDIGALVANGASQDEAEKSVDEFIKDSFGAMGVINLYAHAMNVISLVPVLALMLLVATLLAYSILKLRSVESINTLGAMFKIVGSFTWASGAISTFLTVIISFFIGRSVINILPLALFFVVLMIRSIIFVINESKLYLKQLEQQEAEQMEV